MWHCCTLGEQGTAKKSAEKRFAGGGGSLMLPAHYPSVSFPRLEFCKVASIPSVSLRTSPHRHPSALALVSSAETRRQRALKFDLMMSSRSQLHSQSHFCCVVAVCPQERTYEFYNIKPFLRLGYFMA